MITKKIIIIDYGMGNLTSVRNAFAFLGAGAVISNKVGDIQDADAIVVPGVGAFGQAMENLKALRLIEPLTEQVVNKKIPFLGICLGMQLIAEDSEEHGRFKGLGWIPGSVRRLAVKDGTRLPHIGWNDITVTQPDPLFSAIKNDFNFYFVHSYHVLCDERYISAYCQYDIKVTAALQKDNIFATQFHPEKSQENGLRVLRSFVKYVESRNDVSVVK